MVSDHGADDDDRDEEAAFFDEMEALMPAEEVERRLPELEFITDAGLRREVRSTVQTQCPEYFWEAPATGHDALHNPLCRGEHGLWAHTKMVVTAYERMVESFVEQGRISEQEADYGRAACLLHDMHKFGAEYTGQSSAAPDHDIQMAATIRLATALPEAVADAVAAHMGPFEKYAGPDPETELERLVHTADMMGSCRFGTMWFYKPCSELREAFPDANHYDDPTLPWEDPL